MRDIAVDPSSRYAFLAVEGTSNHLQVIDLQLLRTSPPGRVATATLVSGFGRAVLYKSSTDRIYFLGDRRVAVYRPS